MQIYTRHDDTIRCKQLHVSLRGKRGQPFSSLAKEICPLVKIILDKIQAKFQRPQVQSPIAEEKLKYTPTFVRKQNFDHELVSRSYSCCALDINSKKYMEIWTWIAKQNKDKNLFTEGVHCRESISTREFDTSCSSRGDEGNYPFTRAWSCSVFNMNEEKSCANRLQLKGKSHFRLLAKSVAWVKKKRWKKHNVGVIYLSD